MNQDNRENKEFVPQEEKEVKEDKSFKLKEEKHISFWYWLLALALILLFGWYGYRAGWFASGKKMSNNKESSVLIEKKNKDFQKNLAHIQSLQIKTGKGFPVTKTLLVKGQLEDSCTYLNDPEILRDGNTFYIQLTTRKENGNCSKEVKMYEYPIQLDVLGLPAGIYTLVINGKKAQFELKQDNKIEIPENEEK